MAPAAPPICFLTTWRLFVARNRQVAGRAPTTQYSLPVHILLIIALRVAVRCRKSAPIIGCSQRPKLAAMTRARAGPAKNTSNAMAEFHDSEGYRSAYV